MTGASGRGLGGNGEVDFLRLQRIAEKLRSENTELREEVAKRSALAGEMGPSSGRTSPIPAARPDPVLLSENAAAVEKLTELSRDLHAAVKRSVEQRVQVERQHATAEELHVRRKEQLTAEINDVTLEVAAAQERRALEEDLGRKASDARAWARAAAAWEGAATAQELHAARSALETSKMRESELREEVRDAQEMLAQTRRAAWTAPQRPPSPKRAVGEDEALRDLREKVVQLQKELSVVEARQGHSEEEDYEEELRWRALLAPSPARLGDLSALRARLMDDSLENAEREGRVRQGELELEELRAVAFTLSSEVFSEERAAEERKAEAQAMRVQAESYESEEELLSTAAEPIRKELDVLTERYEEQKRLLAIYTASLLRGPRAHGGSQPRTRGLLPLIRALASQFGTAP